MTVLEICVDSVESAIAAERGGARRVELCSDLLEGGITPSLGLLEMVRRRVGIDVFVMIRPRGGDFCYTDDELAVMKVDIDHAKRLGADGVVLGILDAEGRVDVERTRELVELAQPLPVTFHRAVDVSADLWDSLDRIVATGAQRVLTSGGKRRVADSTREIADAIERTRGRLTIMAGGGLNPENIRAVAEETGAEEYHASLNTGIESPVRRNDSLFLGADPERDYTRYVVREEDVRSLYEGLKEVVNGRTTVGRTTAGHRPTEDA
ncbi:MAG TPA: copper homeostasis protein CutC [Bryobacteraceae bacterium]|nr:copper homeostasis protein CutC [Bryobacteraceae bacterium]